MPFGPPRKPRPPIPQPSPEEAEFFLLLAGRRPRPPRFDRSRFPYAPGPARRYPWSPGGLNPYGPEKPEAQAPAPEPQQPPAPAAKPPAAPPSTEPEPPPWRRPHPGYRGLLAPREPRGLLDLDVPEPFPTSVTDGFAQWAAMPPAAPAQAQAPPARQVAQAGMRGTIKPGEAQKTEPGMPLSPRGSLLPGDPAHPGAVGGLSVPPDHEWPARPPSGTRPIDEELKYIAPEKRADFLHYDPLFDTVQKLRDYHVGLSRMSGVGPATRRALDTFMSWEIAGVPDYSDPRDPNNERPAVSGISPRTLDSLIEQNLVPDLEPGTRPMDLGPWQWAEVHVAVLDHALREAGGIRALEQMPPGIAAAAGDIILRLGQGAGVRALQRSVEAVREARRKRGVQIEKLLDDGHFGNKTLKGIIDAVRSPEDAEIFKKHYLQERESALPREKNRNKYTSDLIS